MLGSMHNGIIRRSNPCKSSNVFIDLPATVTMLQVSFFLMMFSFSLRQSGCEVRSLLNGFDVFVNVAVHYARELCAVTRLIAQKQVN